MRNTFRWICKCGNTKMSVNNEHEEETSWWMKPVWSNAYTFAMYFTMHIAHHIFMIVVFLFGQNRNIYTHKNEPYTVYNRMFLNINSSLILSSLSNGCWYETHLLCSVWEYSQIDMTFLLKYYICVVKNNGEVGK